MIRFGIIGTSDITTRMVASIGEVEGATVAAVYSRDIERAKQKAAEYGAGVASDDLETLLTSGEIDAIYIASPNAVHGDQARQAVEAGIHVLVEKPAVTAAAEWTVLTSQSTTAGVVLLEAIRTEYDPGTELVRSLLPRLGQLRSASFRYQSRSARYDKVLAGERVNMFDPAFAGGALFDLGVYCVHAMVTLFGEPTKVLAASVPVASGVDGAGTAVAVYPDFTVTLDYSKITATTLPSEIQGEEATLVVDHIASPRVVRLVQFDGSEETFTAPSEQHTLSGSVRRLVELVNGDSDASADHNLTLATLRVVDQIRAAPGA